MSYGLLNRVQITVLALRDKGLGLGEIARMLGLSKQAVWSIEKRARRLLENAAKTLAAYELATAASVIVVNPDTDLAKLPSYVIREADANGVKLRLDYAGIYVFVRNESKKCTRDNGLDNFAILIFRDGRLRVYCLREIESLLDLAGKIVEV
ncbi:Tfx family DNA-binding protein [Hyperthermus butylicus]|uniref:Conserved archaeal protein n=1 Tax=Hyperthermus butylicus (strain DSM 5456 / JCM 9403 / PLM1-5) TaxID=415426 RepID=A2BJT4_HYPBU|nr:Tfx family DNA-binding protein [Hyperthermus butylicus]ABM80245.1 putative conserved archaeal protein [Hyperthermus butylicus DSM 5456]